MKVLTMLIYALFLVLPFGQLERLPQPYPGVNLYLHDLVIAAIVCLWSITGLKKLKPPPLARPLLWFTAAALASLLPALFRHPPNQILVGSLYLVRFVFYSCLYFVFSDPALVKNLRLKPANLLLVFGLSLVGLGLFQYLFFPDVRFLAASGWDDHFYRVISSLFDPNFTGLIYLFSLILLFFHQKKLQPLVYSSATAAVLIGLLLTYSRSSYLALLAAAAVYSIIKRKSRVFLVAASCVLLAFLLLPRPGGEGVNLLRTFSIGQRLTNYRQGLTLWRQHPVLGAGFNLVRYQPAAVTDPGKDLSHAAAGYDASLIFVLATTGLIGLAAYLNLLVKACSLSPLAQVSLAAALTHSLFTNSLFYPWVMIWLFCLFTFKNPLHNNL
ncbi:TPA: hypothetical protein DEB02_00005 [Candidatus Beckwithbacteria bacterium]|nr:hypothetical protein [Candidatus Beckwithbacteria bacterium]